jgi:hypothetical protein
MKGKLAMYSPVTCEHYSFFIYGRYLRRIQYVEVLRNLYDWVSISKNTYEYLSLYTNIL